MPNRKQAIEALDGVTVAAHVDAQGNIHIDNPLQLPPGEIWLTLGFVSPESLDEEDALWEAAIVNNPEKFERLLAEADQAIAEGTIDELNPDDMLP